MPGRYRFSRNINTIHIGFKVKSTNNNVTLPLSVVIITRDAAGQLSACLQSTVFADETVVIDSGSEDGTVELAKDLGARVIHHDWQGFGQQKQFAVNQAKHDWVLCLDSDEQVSEELRASIETTLRMPEYMAYKMARCNRFMGRYLRHGEGYPDWSLRLFHRGHASWSDDNVHEKVLTQTSLGELSGDLLHESEQGLSDYLDKQNRYTSLQALSLHQAGKKVGCGKLVLSPLARFVKFYLLRGGFLDGAPGLIHISVGCFNTFSKYAKLMEYNRGAR